MPSPIFSQTPTFMKGNNSVNKNFEESNTTTTTTNPKKIGEQILITLNNVTFEPPFPWARSDPYIYVQQIILRSSVIPWKDNLILTDAFRGPLYEVFKLLEIVRNHEDENR